LGIGDIQTLQIGNDWFGERQSGLNRVYSELMVHLPDAGVQVRGLVAGSPRVEAETGGAIRAFASPSAPLWLRLLKARRAVLHTLRNNRIDLLVSHFALYSFPVVDRLQTLPVVIHFHGPWAGESDAEGLPWATSKLQAGIERAVYSRGNQVIVLSTAFQNELVLRYRIPEERIHRVPGGVDIERFNLRATRREARESLGWPLDRPLVLAVRRQKKRMGLENLIDAIREVRKRIPDILCMLGGSGDLAGEIRQRIQDRSLEHNVRLLGRIDDADLPAAYRAADLSVVPSQSLEGFGMTTLESLALGTPVLVTPVGGLPEVVAPFAPQCVFDDSSAATMAAVLCECLLGKRYLPTDEACREYATQNFSWPVIAAATRKVYELAIQ